MPACQSSFVGYITVDIQPLSLLSISQNQIKHNIYFLHLSLWWSDSENQFLIHWFMVYQVSKTLKGGSSNALISCWDIDLRYQLSRTLMVSIKFNCLWPGSWHQEMFSSTKLKNWCDLETQLALLQHWLSLLFGQSIHYLDHLCFFLNETNRGTFFIMRGFFFISLSLQHVSIP